MSSGRARRCEVRAKARSSSAFPVRQVAGLLATALLAPLLVWGSTDRWLARLEVNLGYASWIKMAAGSGSVAGGEARAAQAHFQRALGHRLSEWRAYAGLGRLATLQRSDQEAAAHWAQAAALAPGDPLMAYQLGLAWEAAGDHERALAAWRLAGAQVRFTTEGVYWERLKDLQAAQARYRLALEVAPDWGPAWSGLGRVYYLEMGRAALEAGDLEEAERQLRTAVELDPVHGRGYRLLGQALLRQGRLPEAEGALLEAALLEPDSTWSYAILGDVYTAWGRTAEAQQAYERAIYEEPAASRAHAQAGDALCRLGRPEEALGCYWRAFLLGSRSQRVQQAIEAISRTGACPLGE